MPRNEIRMNVTADVCHKSLWTEYNKGAAATVRNVVEQHNSFDYAMHKGVAIDKWWLNRLTVVH